MRGVLLKRGDHFTSSWRPRHFQLGNDGVLRYKVYQADAAWRGELCLEGCRVDAESGAVAAAEGTVYPLTITHTTRRVNYHLATDGETGRTAWYVHSRRPCPPVRPSNIDPPATAVRTTTAKGDRSASRHRCHELGRGFAS